MIGLDAGDRSSFYCVIDGKGEVTLGAKVATGPETLKERHARIFRGSPSSRSFRGNQSRFAFDAAPGKLREGHASFISAFLKRVTLLQGHRSIVLSLQDRSLGAANMLHAADG